MKEKQKRSGFISQWIAATILVTGGFGSAAIALLRRKPMPARAWYGHKFSPMGRKVLSVALAGMALSMFRLAFGEVSANVVLVKLTAGMVWSIVGMGLAWTVSAREHAQEMPAAEDHQ